MWQYSSKAYQIYSLNYKHDTSAEIIDEIISSTPNKITHKML